MTTAETQQAGEPPRPLPSSPGGKRSRGSRRPIGDMLLPYGLLLPILAFEIGVRDLSDLSRRHDGLPEQITSGSRVVLGLTTSIRCSAILPSGDRSG